MLRSRAAVKMLRRAVARMPSTNSSDCCLSSSCFAISRSGSGSGPVDAGGGRSESDIWCLVAVVGGLTRFYDSLFLAGPSWVVAVVGGGVI